MRTVAGNDGHGGSGKRDGYEKAAGLWPDGKPELRRTMSISDFKSATADSVKNDQPLYVGQGEPVGKKARELGINYRSSAFVFGQRIQGEWKFMAQVVKGNMAAIAEQKLVDDVSKLSWVRSDLTRPGVAIAAARRR